jgi:phosphoglycolate phosphatase-like HAD superfamily hydrolase
LKLAGETMHLVMFDVDGTLVTGNGIDDICFSDAVEEVLGVSHIDTDWSHYLNQTDSGVIREIVERSLSRVADDHDILAVRHSYVTRLRHEIEKDSFSFRSVPGASELIASLSSMESVSVCIATGGWQDAALAKLGAVGISIESTLLASSDDSHDRVSIMLSAYERARAQTRCGTFDSVLYVGDRRWDFENSRRLGYDFVGVGGRERGLELRRAGAEHVLPDLTDWHYFLGVLGLNHH